MIAVIQESGSSEVMGIVEGFFRWIHVVAGVLWIGILYFFNWVNGAFAATMDAETKKKVVPELMPRALFFFRWGAAYTWIFGVFLLFILYYHGPYFLEAGATPTPGEWLQGFAGIIVGFLVYDQLFKTLGKANHAAAVVVWGAIAVGFAAFLMESTGCSTRSAYIHVGALFGTSMAANVWMRIWPAQKRIITAIKNGEAPDAADPALAGLRSKHNTYMSVPLLLLMVAVNQPAILGLDPYVALPAILVIGFVVTKAIYAKAGQVQGF
jgi:uncharacterized membrane protein